MTRTAAVLLVVLAAVTASAQRPLFDPDDFLDPRDTGGRPVFISRVVIGAASNMSGDGVRPLGENVGYIHLANSFSWRSVQFDYKRSQMNGEPAVLEYDREQQFRQTRNATPKSRDELQAAWYWPIPAGGGIPVMLRSRVTYATQPIETEFVEGTERFRVSTRERTFALDTDTWFRIAGRDVYGSLAISETKLGDLKERTLAYTNRFPSIPMHRARILIRPTLTVGGITNRGGSALNLLNPAIEIFRPFPGTGANLHVIYSPQWVSGAEGWRTTHQVAVLIDRALFVKVF
jgi:hypothetical protein